MTPQKPKLRKVEEAEPSPVRRMSLTADRILVSVPDESERKSKAGLLIPATAATPVRRCVWSNVILVGPGARGVKAGDRVLFIPQTGLEVEWEGDTYLLLRERDIQAIASDRTDSQSGQYL
ncbi:MAG TPA: co-chaperone GroES [Actinomycetota bacterium]|jgi:chaperonin GroES